MLILSILLHCRKSYNLSPCNLRVTAQKLTKFLHDVLRAYTVYVRPLVEHNSIVWSPCTIKGIETIECVQHQFTKNLRGYSGYLYPKRLPSRSTKLRTQTLIVQFNDLLQNHHHHHHFILPIITAKQKHR